MTNWTVLNGYNIMYNECQDSDMVHIGFLSRVWPILWREDLKKYIKNTKEGQFSPFHFCLYHSTLSCNRKGIMAPVLMVDIDRNSIEEGINFFRSCYDGKSTLSTCSIPYLFFLLCQNQLTDDECCDIINDALQHTGQVSLVHLSGIKDVDAQGRLQQNVFVKLRTILLSIQTSTPLGCCMFFQVEKEADPNLITCAFYIVDMEAIMLSLPNISNLLCSFAKEEDHPLIFLNCDYSIGTVTKTIPLKKGSFQVSSKPIPVDVQAQTEIALSNIVKPPVKRTHSASTVSSNASTSNKPSTSSLSMTSSPTQQYATTPAEQCFRIIEQNIAHSSSCIDKIEELCLHMKTNTDNIANQIALLHQEIIRNGNSSPCNSPLSKTASHS